MRVAVEIIERKSFTKKQRAEAFLRASGKCQCGCGGKILGRFEINHIIPLAMGGRHIPENWEVLLPEHHALITKDHLSKIAKAKRAAKKFGIEHDPDRERKPSRLKSRGFDKALRKKMDGTVERR